jgi:citrate synthase
MAASLPKTMHPMAALAALTQSLTAFYPEFNQADPSAELRHKSIAVALGHITTLAAVIHRNRSHLNIAPIDQKYDLTEHFHHHFFGKVGSDISINALHKLFILHADHEQNCSTSTVRLVGSSKAPLFAALSAGINALWGPLHGGANQAVLEMLQDIQRSGQDVKKILARAKDKQDTFRLMGFGHRVYKNFDPRAKIIKSACDSLLTQLEKADPMLDLAKELEQAALSDPYFIERKLYPNVDFYSGIIYRALGIPVDMFTVMFAVGRLPGWLAHWQEMVTAGDMRIGRPRQIYTGPTSRPVPKG